MPKKRFGAEQIVVSREEAFRSRVTTAGARNTAGSNSIKRSG